MEDARIDAVVCGRKIGTADGWDQVENNFIVLYEFEPGTGITIPAGDLAVDYDGGRFEILNDDGEVTFEADIVATLAGLPQEAA